MPFWRREVEVRLDTVSPDLPTEKREELHEAMDRYFPENPTAERDAHFLPALREDYEAFPEILREAMSDGPDCSSS